MHVFLSEYSPTYVNVEQRRARLRSELMAKGGGPLGIESVKEIVVGVRDLDAARALWQKLLDAAPSSTSNAWQVGGGPAIRLVPATENSVHELVVTVSSLQTAVGFLQEKGLLGVHCGQEATIDPSRIHGLNIRLVAKK